MWPITGGTPAYLEYLTSTGRTDRVRVPGLGLDDKQRAITRDLVRPRFRQDVNSLRFASGSDESSVVDWILTGSPPTLRPALLKHESFPVTVPGDTTYTSERVIITIQAPHVTEREFRRLYALTRRAWRQARRTHLTAAMRVGVRSAVWHHMPSPSGVPPPSRRPTGRSYSR